MWRDSFICVTRHLSCICVCGTCLIHTCEMTHSCVFLGAFICVTCLIHMCDMTHSYVWHDSFTYETGISTERCLIAPYFICFTFVWRHSFICVARLFLLRNVCVSTVCVSEMYVWVLWFHDIYDMRYARRWHASFTYVTWLIHIWIGFSDRVV